MNMAEELREMERDRVKLYEEKMKLQVRVGWGGVEGKGGEGRGGEERGEEWRGGEKREVRKEGFS